MSISSIQYTEPSNCPSPKLTTIQFGTAEHIDLRRIKLDDPNEVSNETESVIPTLTLPPQIQIRIDTFEQVHAEREVEDKLKAQEEPFPHKYTPAALPIPIRRDLEELRTAIPESFIPTKVHGSNANNWAWTDSDTESWDGTRVDNKTSDFGPSPYQTKNSATWSECGEHPGSTWEMNDPGCTHYYPITIPDPVTCRLIVAPFIKYHITSDSAIVTVTYGKGHPTYTRMLHPIPVRYSVPPMTPKDLTILDPQSPFAKTIGTIVSTYFPHELSITFRQYQNALKQQVTLQNIVNNLLKKKEDFRAKAAETQSALERANFLGRLIGYNDEISNDLETNAYSLAVYNDATKYFNGVITQSALDPRPNPWRRTPQNMYKSPVSTPGEDSLTSQWLDPSITTAIENYVNDRLDHKKANRKALSPFMIPSLSADTGRHRHNKSAKRCHRCQRRGHIRKECRAPKATRRK
jgi:hypothetical protein